MKYACIRIISSEFRTFSHLWKVFAACHCHLDVGKASDESQNANFVENGSCCGEKSKSNQKDNQTDAFGRDVLIVTLKISCEKKPESTAKYFVENALKDGDKAGEERMNCENNIIQEHWGWGTWILDVVDVLDMSVIVHEQIEDGIGSESDKVQ